MEPPEKMRFLCDIFLEQQLGDAPSLCFMARLKKQPFVK